MLRWPKKAPDIIAQVAVRAGNFATQTDQMDVWKSRIGARLTSQDLNSSIDALGFAPPPLLVELYQKIGNGGFGPGYGLMGLLNGTGDDQRNTAVSLYTSFCSDDPEDPIWQWPRQLLPICHWGCAIYSCIDCKDADPRVVIWDPNLWDDGISPQDVIRPMDLTLSRWLAAWANGEDLWTRMFPA